METVKETAKSELHGVQTLAQQTLKSGTYLYPLRGMVYFFSHRKLWGSLTSKIVPLATLSVGVVVPMFVFTYVPQSILLTFVNGPLAWVSTVLLVLSESAAIINGIARAMFIDEALVDLFDAVLLEENATGLVQKEREVKTEGGVKRLGKALSQPLQRFTPKAIISYFLWLPLNFVPVVGTAMFLLVQGRKQGPGFHARYFQLKGFSAGQRETFVQNRRPEYLAFGSVAMLLGLVPGASILFAYTSTVGAALWALDIEKKKAVPVAGESDGHEEKKEL